MKEKNIKLSDFSQPKLTSKVAQREIIAAPTGSNRQGSTRAPLLNRLLKNRTFLLLGFIGIVGVSVFAWLLYTVISFEPASPNRFEKLTGEYLPVHNSVAVPPIRASLVVPSIPRTKTNPINGVLLTQSELEKISVKRPVAVMINNHAAARPTSNLQQADIIYETLVESGITRQMAVFWQNSPDKVGTMRSARQPYLEWLSEYDAVYLHDGYSSSDDPRLDAGGNIYRYGIKSISTQGAWRDNTRVAPHNEYTSVAYANQIAEKNKWTGLPTDFKGWSFKNDATRSARGDIGGADIRFHTRLTNGGLYNVLWKYDSSSNSFKREIGGIADIDHESGSQLYAKSVIIQVANIIPSGNEKGHILTTTIGEGDATILIDGKAVNAKWKKPSRAERTKYYDSANNEFSFNRGLVWVEIISKTDSSFAIIEQ